VFANLGLALRDVIAYWKKNGMENGQELLWADQICINQSDSEERSHQVNQMRDTYAAASIVLVALATRDSDSCGADGVEWILDLRQKLQDMNCKGMLDTWDSSCKKRLSAHITESFVHPSFQEGFVAFFHLLRSPWWQRAWVIQEFIVASEAVFLYRQASISWQDFATVTKHLTGQIKELYRDLKMKIARGRVYSHLYKTPPTAMLKHFENSRELSGYLEVSFGLIQRKYHWKGPGDLKVWLECGRMCQTSDPRDRFYAFLGLAHPRYNIIPDYSPSNTLDKVILEVAKRIVHAENTLNMLSHVSRLPTGRLPSWVPDWSNFPQQFYRFQETPETITSPWCLETELATPFIEFHGAALRVEGIKIDTIIERPLLSKEELAFRGRPISFSTRRGFSLVWVDLSNYQRNDCLWCFPGSSIVFVLRPVNSHWILQFTSPLGVPMNDKGKWATGVRKLVSAGDYAGLLAIEGLNKEVIEIH
jgi:hypothetical protein